MVFIIIIAYLIIAALSTGWFYSERLRYDDYDCCESFCDHEYDTLISVLGGAFFPVTLPFAVPIALIRNRYKDNDDER